MAILIDPNEDPIERSLALCSEVSFELKQDVFTIEFPDPYDQPEDVPFKTTVIISKPTFQNSPYPLSPAPAPARFTTYLYEANWRKWS